MRHKVHETDNSRKMRTKATSAFLRRVMTDSELPSSYTEPELPKLLIVPKLETKTSKTQPPSPLTSTEIVTPKQGYDDDVVT